MIQNQCSAFIPLIPSNNMENSKDQILITADIHADQSGKDETRTSSPPLCSQSARSGSEKPYAINQSPQKDNETNSVPCERTSVNEYPSNRKRRSRKDSSTKSESQSEQRKFSILHVKRESVVNDSRRMSKIEAHVRKYTGNVDEDMKRKLRQEIDVSMVTLLQPTEMLRSEMFLHEAARKNSVDKVRELIGQKVDVNCRNNLDRTAIQWAAANGNMEVVSLLIHAGADVEAQDKYGMKALLWAAWFGHLDTIRVLVNGGANTSSVNKQGLNILHCAAQNNHVDLIRFICDSLEHFKMDDVEKNERTGVHLAAEKGHMDALEKLIEFKADIQLKDKSGQTAAHLAAVNGHEEVIKRLLLDGIEVDERDNEGQTPLVLAAIGGHLNTVEMLLQANADPNAESTKQMTALMAASQVGKKDVVAALLEFGCNVNVQNHQSNTSVHLATLGNHIEVLRLLIDAYAELNLNNKRMQTPLHAAVENGLADAVEVLLIAGADIEAKEKTGKTALQMASRGSFIGIVDMIIKAERHNQLIATDGKLSVCTGGGSEINIQFKRPNHECTEFMKDILWKMATKQLKPGDWKKLAHHWKFTDAHIKAIEHQYTGPHSYTEHGYRLLLIWLHSVKREDSPIKHLFEALLAIDRRELAEHIRRKANVSADKSTSPKICRVS